MTVEISHVMATSRPQSVKFLLWDYLYSEWNFLHPSSQQVYQDTAATATKPHVF